MRANSSSFVGSDIRSSMVGLQHPPILGPPSETATQPRRPATASGSRTSKSSGLGWLRGRLNCVPLARPVSWALTLLYCSGELSSFYGSSYPAFRTFPFVFGDFGGCTACRGAAGIERDTAAFAGAGRDAGGRLQRICWGPREEV